ncbi:uncharacterized protein BX664DRAFT_282272 [Halteromyces radiatus]|uniref:uncharacterized protein n=1 Tax=Halteromyces radiatus TaxID=101107 RepID=UPI0022209A59|nr:uncharacterized protein BX664DRAFT_282272 [Halteromyces radiatus]KAI8086385.1 hypothetical protein BX664DRAFT_282272 [Halteromyces radiatus]
MMHPLVINDHPYYQQPQVYVKTPTTPPTYNTHHPYDNIRSSYHPSTAHPYHYSPQSSQPPRRASMATPATILSRQRSSTKSLRDRRKSSGTLSTSSQQQYHKPRKCIGDYYVGKTLGKGASGRVKLGIHRHTGEQVAIKIISKAHLAANPAIEKAVRREIAIMKLIQHPNVMALIDVIDDPNSSDLNLILEYVQGGELFEYLVSKGRLSDSEARRHFQQIILGLDFCHHHLICHRDLKPENLLLDSTNNIKIADFGMASLQPAGSMLETSCGSPHYASPEIVAGMPYNGSASDIWSCGVILYALLTGHLPFDDENIRQLLKKVKAGKYTMPDDISRNAQDLIRRILVVDPSKRLTMDQIMAHPWFCESEPVNLASLPVPPTANEIGRPVWDSSEIDDRILETIKFLWGETRDDVIIQALISKEHNMQKVVYVLLQQHSERYWQNDHDDDDIRDNDAPPNRRYQTIGHRSERNRRCMSMVDNSSKTTSSRPSVPWMPDSVAYTPSIGSHSSSIVSTSANMTSNNSRRYSACTVGRADRAIPDFMHPPPLPPLPTVTMTSGDKTRLKKSETFYARFIKNVLTSRRQSKSSITGVSSYPYSTIRSTLAGTLRRKNPFGKMMQQETTTTEPSEPQQTTESDQSPSSPCSSTVKTLNTKRLSIRVPNAFRNDNGTNRFSFTLNGTRRQRKELDMSMFQTQKQRSSISTRNEGLDSDLTPPPALSDGSTLSSSISSSSTKDHHHQQQQQHGNTSLQSVTERRGSNTSSTLNRPITPSLLSNSSTITTAKSASFKASWLNNLFFFKQPKICSLIIPETDIGTILCTLHRLMNQSVEAKFYEKDDKQGIKRYKADIKSKHLGKTRQVKCRLEILEPSTKADSSSRLIRFTQQQGDGVVLASVVRNIQYLLEQEYPTMSSAITAGF